MTSEKSGIAFLSVPDFTYPSADQAAVDGLKAYLQRDLPVNSPFRKPLIKAVAGAYPTQKAAAQRLGVSESLISRVMRAPDHLKEVRIPDLLNRLF